MIILFLWEIMTKIPYYYSDITSKDWYAKALPIIIDKIILDTCTLYSVYAIFNENYRIFVRGYHNQI